MLGELLNEDIIGREIPKVTVKGDLFTWRLLDKKYHRLATLILFERFASAIPDFALGWLQHGMQSFSPNINELRDLFKNYFDHSSSLLKRFYVHRFIMRFFERFDQEEEKRILQEFVGQVYVKDISFLLGFGFKPSIQQLTELVDWSLRNNGITELCYILPKIISKFSPEDFAKIIDGYLKYLKMVGINKFRSLSSSESRKRLHLWDFFEGISRILPEIKRKEFFLWVARGVEVAEKKIAEEFIGEGFRLASKLPALDQTSPREIVAFKNYFRAPHFLSNFLPSIDNSKKDLESLFNQLFSIGDASKQLFMLLRFCKYIRITFSPLPRTSLDKLLPFLIRKLDDKTHDLFDDVVKTLIEFLPKLLSEEIKQLVGKFVEGKFDYLYPALWDEDKCFIEKALPFFAVHLSDDQIQIFLSKLNNTTNEKPEIVFIILSHVIEKLSKTQKELFISKLIEFICSAKFLYSCGVTFFSPIFKNISRILFSKEQLEKLLPKLISIGIKETFNLIVSFQLRLRELGIQSPDIISKSSEGRVTKYIVSRCPSLFFNDSSQRLMQADQYAKSKSESSELIEIISEPKPESNHVFHQRRV
jgi:hypothetical protein